VAESMAIQNPESGANACPESRLWLIRYQPQICWFVPAVAVFCFLAWCFIAFKSGFSWDDAEPEILDQAWRLARGESIYRGIDAPPYAIPIYPPLYLAFVATLMKFTGLSYLPAKLLSFVAGLSIGWALIRLNREWNKSGQGGVWAAFLLFLIPAFLYNVLRSHVQMMAVALSFWSFVFFIRNRWKETLILSPMFAALAFYTKQTQIALPLAMAIYLAMRHRRWLIPYLSLLALGVLIPFLWLQKITNGHFFTDTVPLARLNYDPLMIPQIFLHHAGPILVFIVIAALTFYRRILHFRLEPIDCYFGCVFAITLFSLGRIGAHGQYVVELLVVTLAYLLRTTGLPAVRGWNIGVSIQVLILFLYAPIFVFLEEGLWDRAANKASGAIYDMIRGEPGPILSQQGSFALFSRGEIYIQLFHFTGLSRAGRWDQSRILNDIAQRKFPYVITEFPIENPANTESSTERFTPEMLSALRNNYRRARFVHPYFVYIPGR
jgi:hypothetical protein